MRRLRSDLDSHQQALHCPCSRLRTPGLSTPRSLPQSEESAPVEMTSCKMTSWKNTGQNPLNVIHLILREKRGLAACDVGARLQTKASVVGGIQFFFEVCGFDVAFGFDQQE